MLDEPGRDGRNGANDVFLFARATGTVTLVSHVPGAPGTAGNGASSGPRISADGASVAFRSAATDLVTGTDTNGATARCIGVPRRNIRASLSRP